MKVDRGIPYRRQVAWRLVIIMVTFILGFICATTALAADILDDSLSPRRQYSVQLEWAHKERPSKLSRSEYLLLTARIPHVEVRLDTSKYIGQTARIYLKLPRQITGLVGTSGFRLSWVTKGLFQGGEIKPGGRVLIYDGIIQMPVMTDFFTFSLTVDADKTTGTLQHAPIYEIETD